VGESVGVEKRNLVRNYRVFLLLYDSNLEGVALCNAKT